MTRKRASQLKGICVYFPVGMNGGILSGIITDTSDSMYASVNSHVKISDVRYEELYETYEDCRESERLRQMIMSRIFFR